MTGANELQMAPDLSSALEAFSSYGHNAAVGLTLRGHGDGWIEFGIDWRPELTEDPDETVLATGIIYSALDSACALTTWAKRGYFTMNPTLDLRVDFLRPATPRTGIIARAECHAITPELALMRGIAHEGDPDDPIAQCNGAFIFVGKP